MGKTRFDIGIRPSLIDMGFACGLGFAIEWHEDLRGVSLLFLVWEIDIGWMRIIDDDKTCKTCHVELAEVIPPKLGELRVKCPECNRLSVPVNRP
jgi:hypothetical protein